jgi:glycerol-3-phosphate acyltransferase PlsY
MFETILALAGGYLLGSIPFAYVVTQGKGVATCLGILAALNWPVALASFGTWLAVLGVGRISSLAALVAAIAAPIYMAIWGPGLYAAGAVILAALVFVTHRDNIARLLKGEEPRVGQKKA